MKQFKDVAAGEKFNIPCLSHVTKQPLLKMNDSQACNDHGVFQIMPDWKVEVVPTLTSFQEMQLLHLHLEGELRIKNEEGNLYPRPAWRKMIKVLSELNYIDSFCRITKEGKAYLDKKHEEMKNGRKQRV